MIDTEIKSPPSDIRGPEKGKVIRNRDVDKAARALADEHVLPEVPGSKLSWSQTEEYFKLLTPGMWSHVSVYVYRVKPKIRRQLRDADLPNYIDCFGEPFTLDQFIGRHGGGRYQLRINDNDKKGQQRDAKTIFICDLDVDDIKYPPILEYAELELDARENQSYITWLRSQGILDARGKVVQPNSTANGSGVRDMVDMFRAVRDITSESQARARPSDDDSLSKSVGNILVEQMRQNDPTKQVQATASLVQNVKEMMDSGKSDSGITKIFELLITMTTDQRKVDAELRAEQSRRDSEQRARDMDMMKMVLEAHKPAPDADVDKLTKMYTLAQQIFGDRPTGRRSGWDIGYDIARDVALPAINSIGNIFTSIMALRGRGPGPAVAPAPAAAPIPLSFDPYRDRDATAAYAASIRNQPPAPTAPPAAPTPAAGPAAAPPLPTQAAPPAAGNAQVMEIFQNYGGLVLNALNNATPGWVFADNLVGLLGTATHAMIAQHGEPALVAAMKSIPEFAVFGDARLTTFVHEFINFESQEYGQEDDGGEDEDEITEISPGKIDISQPYQPRERTARR